MKLTTKLAIAMNLVVVGIGAFVLHQHEREIREAQETADRVAIEVALEMERAEQLQCLATNIYHEARSEGVQGQRAVAWATLNRVAHPDYPDTVCDVVYQAETDENGNPLRNRCQFSWFCDGKSDEIRNQAAWNIANEIADDVMSKYGRETDPTGGSIMYHADYVDPYWASNYKREVRIDSHVFYVKG